MIIGLVKLIPLALLKTIAVAWYFQLAQKLLFIFNWFTSELVMCLLCLYFYLQYLRNARDFKFYYLLQSFFDEQVIAMILRVHSKDKHAYVLPIFVLNFNINYHQSVFSNLHLIHFVAQCIYKQWKLIATLFFSISYL